MRNEAAATTLAAQLMRRSRPTPNHASDRYAISRISPPIETTSSPIEMMNPAAGCATKLAISVSE